MEALCKLASIIFDVYYGQAARSDGIFMHGDAVVFEQYSSFWVVPSWKAEKLVWKSVYKIKAPQKLTKELFDSVTQHWRLTQAAKPKRLSEMPKEVSLRNMRTVVTEDENKMKPIPNMRASNLQVRTVRRTKLLQMTQTRMDQWIIRKLSLKKWCSIGGTRGIAGGFFPTLKEAKDEFRDEAHA